MERLLNELFEVTAPDRLIYDGSHPIDGKNILVTLGGNKNGVLSRGQIIDRVGDIYQLHVKDGEVNCIVATDTSYAETDTEIVVPVYTSGTFRQNECVSEETLTDADLEKFRSLGIYLK